MAIGTENTTEFVQLALAIAAIASGRWLGRLYKRYREAGRERMGLYLGSAIQSWMVTVFITALIVLGGTSLRSLASDLSLTTAIAPDAMVNWSAGLLLAMAAVAWLANEAQDALGIAPTPFSLLIVPRTTQETIVWSLAVSPTAGFCEEILFRGMLLPLAMRETGDAALGIALSSLAFGALHIQQGVIAAVATGAMGAILAAAAIHTGSLWPCIVAHTLYDMAVPFLSRVAEESGQTD